MPQKKLSSLLEGQLCLEKATYLKGEKNKISKKILITQSLQKYIKIKWQLKVTYSWHIACENDATEINLNVKATQKPTAKFVIVIL